MTVTEDQSYQETIKTVRAYMGWNYIPDLEYTVSSGSVKISVDMPPQNWLCWKLDELDCMLVTRLEEKSQAGFIRISHPP